MHCRKPFAGNVWRHKTFSRIRLQGKWLEQLGFRPHGRVRVVPAIDGELLLKTLRRRVGPRISIGKTSQSQQISGMSTIAEIESALKELPLQQAQEIAEWLEKYLNQRAPAKTPPSNRAPVKLPDYATRRRMIFGDKVLPNMVLLAREEERW